MPKPEPAPFLIGIVGHEAAKFTPAGAARAQAFIRATLDRPHVTGVVSGHCHLGGVDIWAETIGRELGKRVVSYPPKQLSWTHGYKPRNLSIALACQAALCIVVDVLPEGYVGMRFERCYHCAKGGRPDTDHVKSGGCWTVLQAMEMGRPGAWKVIRNG